MNIILKGDISDHFCYFLHSNVLLKGVIQNNSSQKVISMRINVMTQTFPSSDPLSSRD